MSEPESKDVLEAGLKALFGPVQELFLKLTGPAAEEYGLMWAESVRMRRTKRLVNGLVKTKRMVEEAGFEPQVVPDKLLLPVFEGMSVEDDEDLHTMWAALLANAASSSYSNGVQMGFVTALKQMAAEEALILRWLADESRKSGNSPISISAFELPGILAFRDSPIASFSLRFAVDYLQTYIINLHAALLIEPRGERIANGLYSSYGLTWKGHALVEACRPPEAMSKG